MRWIKGAAPRAGLRDDSRLRRLRTWFVFLLLPGVCLFVAAGLAQPPASGQAHASLYAPWTFQTNFRNGIPGWISYPLAQDEGYDPSLYTTSEGELALVRDVVARGQKILRVGLLRSLRFHATPSSKFHLKFSLRMGGEIAGARIVLAAANGEKYSSAIPADSGVHSVELRSQTFNLPASGVTVEAMMIEADVDSPILGSLNRLTLYSLEVEAERPPSIPLGEAQFEISPVSGVSVARQIVTPQAPLDLHLGAGPAGRAVFYNEAGARVAEETVAQRDDGTRRVQFAPSPASAGLWKVGLRSGAAQRSFRFLVLGGAPPHPRVLLNASRLAQLRSGAAYQPLRDLIHREAAQLAASLAYNADAGANIGLLSPVSVFPGLPQYFQLLESYSRAIAFNALDFQLNGSQQSLNNARRALETISAWTTWTPPWFPEHGLQTYYEVGVFTQRVAFGYDLIATYLSASEKSSIASALWRNSIQPTLEDYFFNDRLPEATSNHMANSVGGAIEACVALDGNVPDWNSRFGPALADLLTSYESLMKGLFPGDGSEAEPAGYADFAMEGLSWAAAALQSLGIRPRGTQRMLHAFWWTRYAQYAPGRVLDTGDFDGDLSSLTGYAWGAENGDDPALRAFYDSAPRRTLMGVFKVEHTGRKLEVAPGLLDLACCTRPARAIALPAPSRIFPLRGSAVMRSGWAPGSTVISLRVGPWFNHEHHDEGSFQVAAWGEKLIAEAGYTDYYKDPRYANYFIQAPAHNTVLLDGDPFSQEDYDGRYWSAFSRYPRFLGHVFSDSMDYIAADLAPAYNDGAGLQEYVREYIFIKPDLLVVRDQLAAGAPYKYTFLVHPPPGDQAQINGSKVLIRGVHAFAALTAAEPNKQWTAERAPIPEIDYANLDRVTVKPRQTLRLSSLAEAATDFGVAMRLQKESQTPSPLTSFKTISCFGFRSAAGKTLVLFRTSPGMLVAHNTPFGEVLSDADAAAVVNHGGLDDVLAARTTEMRLGGRLLFSVEPYTSRVDIVLRREAGAETVHVDCSKETNLQVATARNPVAVTVDSARIPLLAANGFVSINHLEKGEHVVRIQY